MSIRTQRTVCVTVGILLAVVFGGVQDVIGFLNYLIFLVIDTFFLTYGGYLWAKLKGRHWSWMFTMWVWPLGLLVLSLLPDKSASDRACEGERCLSYFQEELKFGAFQTKEADLYNNAVVEYGMSAGTDSKAAEEMTQAAKRLAESLNEILGRRSVMASIPDTASAVYFAWQATYDALCAWAEAQAAAVSAAVRGMVPHTERVRELHGESEKLRRKAEKEERRFFKQLKISGNEMQRMLAEASVAAENDSWQPEWVKREGGTS